MKLLLDQSDEKKEQTCIYIFIPMFNNVLIIQASHFCEFPNHLSSARGSTLNIVKENIEAL